MQWAITEADRLNMDFALSVDCGYGSGGTHITPDISMQERVWSETAIDGGKRVSVQLAKPNIEYEKALQQAWLYPGQSVNSNSIDQEFGFIKNLRDCQKRIQETTDCHG